jgi:hypothetical protein
MLNVYLNAKKAARLRVPRLPEGPSQVQACHTTSPVRALVFLIGLNVPVSMKCKTDKPERHKDGSGHHHPVRVPALGCSDPRQA